MRRRLAMWVIRHHCRPTQVSRKSRTTPPGRRRRRTRVVIWAGAIQTLWSSWGGERPRGTAGKIEATCRELGFWWISSGCRLRADYQKRGGRMTL